VTARATLDSEPSRIKAALAAIESGLERTRKQPDLAVQLIAKAAETDDTKLVRAQLDAVLPVFADGLKLDRAVLEAWADFDVRVGLVTKRPDVDAAFDFTL
jgi:NitT/TauT family transport system substrate-binding protein/putative hydroxymethylpyrimidine transport system substrate-binding protein